MRKRKKAKEKKESRDEKEGGWRVGGCDKIFMGFSMTW
jgi:hypothetical protein